MCGIYGFYGKPTKQTPKIIQRLGVLNESRGRDSTGIAIVSDYSLEIYKKAVNSTVFFNDLQKTKHVGFYRDSENLIVLGHTRLATHGAVTDRNSHPFQIGNIVMTHNGIISNFSELQKAYDTTYAVDSQIIGHLLDTKENHHKAFKKIAGSFTVPFVRMNERDMLQVAVHSQVFSFAIKGNQLYYSSDIDHLKKALEGSGFQIGQGGDDVLYKFYKVGNGIVTSKERIEAKAMPAYNYAYSYYDWDNYYGKNYPTKRENKWVRIPAKTQSRKFNFQDRFNY